LGAGGRGWKLRSLCYALPPLVARKPTAPMRYGAHAIARRNFQPRPPAPNPRNGNTNTGYWR